ncbi:MAG: hypothetical protein JWQ20_2061 [Conexibacter sp.]|nr:hypothetical protein [Conexibacter sp.]
MAWASLVRTLAAALVAGIALTAGLLAAEHAIVDGPRPRTTPAAVRIRTDRPGPTVGPSFLGLSIEWDSILPYTGPAGHRRDDLLRLLAPLERAAGTPLALRIGGDTGDQAWWNPSRRPRPRNILQDVGPATLNAMAWLARGLHAPVTLGLNLALGDPANARALASQARRRLPRGALAALEIGNEPDLYRHARTFRRGGHVHRRLAKDPHYGVATYARQTDRYLRTLAGPGAPRLVVGGFATNGWWPALPRLLHGWGPRAGALAAHLYALPECTAPTPSAAWLMSPVASRDRVATLRPLVGLARRHRLPLRIAELNSAACGGRPHLSDTRAAALWLTDTLFAALRVGAAGANVHTWRGARYAPFAVAGRAVVPRPPLAGMLAFARAAPTGSHLAAVSVQGASALRAWATVDARGVVRVALLAPEAEHALLPAGGRTVCAEVWRFPAVRRARPCACPSADRYSIHLDAHSLAVVTLGARTTAACSPSGPTRQPGGTP